MFKKKPQIKPLAPLRSSDRRKTADKIIQDLAIELPTPPAPSDAADPEGKAAATAALASLRNALLPDNALSARFTTTVGPDLKQVSGTVYAGAHPGSDDLRILWVKVDEKMYPTVYTLWRNPGIIPLLHTPSFVVEKLQGGADLMTPGLQRGPPFPAKATKGAIVAVASLENPSVPMAVGTCEIDVSALKEVQGARGHAVQTFHWAGDEIWAWSNTGKPGVPPPAALDGWDDGEPEDLAERTERLTVDDHDEGGVPLEGDQAERKQDDVDVSQEGAAPADDLLETVDVQMTTKEIDDAFRKAFLYGVHHYMEQNKNAPNYGLEFPLTQSFVVSMLVQPFLPTYTPAHANFLQIKKTSWKNIRKFIKYLDKQKIVKSKDRDGNEVIILDIDFQDTAIQTFKPYPLPQKTTTASSSSSAAAAGTSLARGDKATDAPAPDSNGDPSIGQKLKRLDLYRPKDKHAPLFTTVNADPRAFYTAADLRPIIDRYIEAEQLACPANKRLLTLNPFLANTFFSSSSDGNATNSTTSTRTIPRDALLARVQESCTRFHHIIREDASPSAPSSSKPTPGPAPPIQITLATRTGHKTVTTIRNLEAYHIAPAALAEELRKTCAGATGLERVAGSSPRNPVVEVMVQGPQREAVVKALERRGVRVPAWVEVLDRTKGRKR